MAQNLLTVRLRKVSELESPDESKTTHSGYQIFVLVYIDHDKLSRQHLMKYLSSKRH